MVKIKQAVILAGGRGLRLRPMTDKIPKPMALINGAPFLDYLINSIFLAGISRILLLVGYKKDVIINHYGYALGKDIELQYSIGKVADLTGRRLLDAYELLDSYFLLVYGDNYWPIPLEKMTANYERLGLPVTTTIFSNKQGTGEYGCENNVVVDVSGRIAAYDKSRRAPGLNGIDIGYFIVEKKVLDVSETGNISFEEKILTRLAAAGRLGAFVTDEQYYYITSIESLRNFEAVALSKGFPKTLTAVTARKADRR